MVRAIRSDVPGWVPKGLADPRWRVRAAAVDVIGKLKVSELAAEVKKLLSDPDGFVVKSTLIALSGLSAVPETEQLVAVARRLPALQGDAVAMMARGASEDAVKLVSELYDGASTEHRVSILKSLAHRERLENRPLDDNLTPLDTAVSPRRGAHCHYSLLTFLCKGRRRPEN